MFVEPAYAAASSWVTAATGENGAIATGVQTVQDNLAAIIPAALPVLIAVSVALIGWRLIRRFMRG